MMKRSHDGKPVNCKEVPLNSLNFPTRFGNPSLKLNIINSFNTGFRKPKKVVIRNLVSRPLDEKYFHNNAKLLEDSVKNILLHGKADESLDKLYQIVAEISKFFGAEPLLRTVSKILDQHVHDVIIHELSSKAESNEFLQTLHKIWMDFKDKLNLLVKIYLEMEANDSNTITSITMWELGICSLRRNLLVSSNFLVHLILKKILANFHEFHQDGTVDKTTLRGVIESMIVLHFSIDLQEYVNEMTKKFYQEETRKNVKTFSLSDYTDYVNRTLIKEKFFFQEVSPSLEEENSKIVYNELVSKHLEVIFYGKDIEGFFHDRNYASINQFYQLMSSNPAAVKMLEEVFFNFLENVGMDIIKDDKEVIEKLIDLKKHADELILHSFESNESLTETVQNAFKKVLNFEYQKVAELNAKFIDFKLRIGAKDYDDNEFESHLDQAIMIFRYNDGKDIFEGYYKVYLAKRLLYGKSASVDAEKTMLSKLRVECGPEFTAKLEDMFKDLEISSEFNESFKRHVSRSVSKENRFKIKINILTSLNWPFETKFDFKIPPPMVNYENLISEFYFSKVSNRKLSWGRNLSHCILKFTLASKTKELQVSLFQTTILFLFNDSDQLTYQEIHEKVFSDIPKGSENFHASELKRVLQSLACGKKDTRILVKVPKGKDVLETDKFIFNKNFQNKLYRIKINEIQFKETKEEKESFEREVASDRKSLIDAAIVRIMKAKKTLIQNNLIQEIFGTLKFIITADEVKLRIDHLIDGGFLRKDATDLNLYHYEA